MRRGKFIVINDGEGSGKTTILRWFAGIPAETTRGKKEKDFVKIARAIDEILK